MIFHQHIDSLRAWLEWHASSNLRSDRDAARSLGIALDIVVLVQHCNCCDGADAARTAETIGKLAEFIGDRP